MRNTGSGGGRGEEGNTVGLLVGRETSTNQTEGVEESLHNSTELEHKTFEKYHNESIIAQQPWDAIVFPASRHMMENGAAL